VRIKWVEFAGAVARVGGAAPGDLVQVAFSGRSNVGKSSLINRLLGRTRTPVARVSATPGKTQQVNFFRVRAAGDGTDREFFLVDLPGYGYARAPQDVRSYWKPLIEGYLRENPRLAGVVQLIDARHDPTPEDLQMVSYLAGQGVPTLFVLTKIDKVKSAARARQVERLTNTLGAEPEQVLRFSARTGEGREELLDTLEELLREDGS
jgi:GTP-binding protein